MNDSAELRINGVAYDRVKMNGIWATNGTKFIYHVVGYTI